MYRRSFLLVGVAVLTVAANAVAEPKKPAVAPPMALVYAQSGYTRTAPLPDTGVHATQLAIGMVRIGCAVELCLEPARLNDATAQIKKAGLTPLGPKDKFQPGVRLHPLSAAGAADIKITAWLKECEQRKTPLATLVLSGHGEERMGVGGAGPSTQFVSVDDKPGDGLALEGISDTAKGLPEVPLLIFYDACRTRAAMPGLNIVNPQGVPAAPGAPPVAAPLPEGVPESVRGWYFRKPGLGYSMPPRDRGRWLTPTVVYSTLSGEAATPKGELIEQLAHGLVHPEDLGKFLQWLHPKVPANELPLTLHDWVLYAVTRMKAQGGVQLNPQVVMGSAPLHTPIAQHGNQGLRAVKVREVEINLIDLYSHKARSLTVERAKDEPTFRVQYTDASAAPTYGEIYVTGHFRGLAMETEQRQLVVDFVVETSFVPGKGQKASKTHLFHIQASSENKKVPNGYIELSNHNYAVTGQFDQCYRATIPLLNVPQSSFDLLAFASHAALIWPSHAAVRVYGLRVVTRPDDRMDIRVPLQQQSLLDGRWAPFDLPENGVENGRMAWALPAKAANSDHPFEFQVKGAAAQGYCGGPIQPAIYVAKNNELIVEVKNTGPHDALLMIDLFSHDPEKNTFKGFANRIEIKLPKNVPVRHTAKLNGEGFAKYLGLTTTATSLAFKTLRVGPSEKVK